MAAIGHGGLKEDTRSRVYEEYSKEKKKETTQEEFIAQLTEKNESKQSNEAKVHKGRSAIIVKGLEDVAVRFSKCCNPVPGDEIIGYVTRGARRFDPPDGLPQYH